MKQVLYLVLIILIYSLNTPGLTREIQNIGIQDSNVTFQGTWTSGSCNDVCVAGNYAYILKGSVFEILNIENPISPIPVGQVVLKEYIYQILVSNNYAYVMRNYFNEFEDDLYGFYILDISDPRNPVEIGFYQLAGDVCRFIDVSDNYIFVVNRNWSENDSSSLMVIDVSNPNNPQVISESPQFEDIAVNFSILDNFVYILTTSYPNGNKICKIDITNPSNPIIYSNYSTGTVGSYQLYVSDNYFYIIEYPNLLIYNNNDSIANGPIGNFNLTNNESVSSIIEFGNYLYIAGTQMDSSDFRSLSLTILDISNPSTPIEISCYNEILTGFWVESMDLSDNYAYVALGPGGLKIIDVSDALNPELTSAYHTGGGIENFASNNDFLYSDNGQFGGISVIDCEQSDTLEMMNFIQTTIQSARVVIENNMLYLLGIPLYESKDYLAIYDISDPIYPQLQVIYELTNVTHPPSDFQVIDDIIYIIMGDGELIILDISNLNEIEEISRTPIFDYGSTIYISDNIAYVGVAWGWGFSFAYISRVDITNPSNPEIIDTLFFAGGWTNKIIVSNNFAYIVGTKWEGGKWFYIIDYANPSDPQIVDYSDWDVRDIFIKDDLAYLTTDAGLEIFDIADPYNLKKMGFYDIEEAKNLAVNEDIIYVSRPSVLYSLKYDFTTKIPNETETISTFWLSQNYPNPFNPSTKISWQLPVGDKATLKVFNILGKKVATLVNEYKPAGKYETKFNAANLPSGVYFYRLQAGDFVQTRKMILLK